MFRDLNQLFAAAEIPCDDTWCLGHIAEMLAEFGPSLILLVGCNGQVIAVDQPGLATHAEEVTSVAGSLEEGLRTQRFCLLEYLSRKGPRLAFGVRLSTMAVGSMLGGLVMPEEGNRERLAALSPYLVACGNLAWQAMEQRASVKRMNARKDQFRIEHETLRTAHIKALDQALEEQQKRIDAERIYSLRLEREVEARSAELREALEDATAKSQELLEYSVALENANLALEQFIQEANAANLAKDQFLATMSHEIRTPMTSILGYADLLAEELPLTGTHKEYLDIVRRNGKHLLDIINDILDLAKIEAGRLEVNLARFSTKRLVEDVCALMELRAKSKGLALSIEFAEDLPETILADRHWLRQILVNLLGNAIKFTAKGGVRVSCRHLRTPDGKPHVVFEVADTGIGIPADKIAKIFEPFTQIDSSSTRAHGGTGLGLTISRRLAEALGGRITVESKWGEGSLFRLAIPIRDATTAECPEPSSADTPETEESEEPRQADDKAATIAGLPGRLDCNILLVEDSPDTQRLVSTILKVAGAQVTIVDNGQAALEALYPQEAQSESAEAEHFDLILMDVQMPVLDGHEATRLLRQRGCDTPIVALTANALVGERDRCRESGCDDYLTKPIDRHRLLSVVQKYAVTAPSGPVA